MAALRRNFRGRARAAVLPLVAGISIAVGGGAAADPEPCDRIADASGYRIVLDTLANRISPGTPANMVPNVDVIQFNLANVIDRVRAQSDHPISVVHCGRLPQASDFGPRFAKKMYENQVLLEVWGTIQIDHDEQDRPFHRAFLNYALMPLCRLDPAPGIPPGVYPAEHKTAPGAKATQVVRLFEDPIEFKAYAAISAGIKAWNAENFEDALELLCIGGTMLRQAMGSTPTAAQQKLAAYVQQLFAEALAEARKNSLSPLTLLTEAEAAACEVTP